MANNIWSSADTAEWETDANWSLGHKPTGTEIAYFDATSVKACTASAAVTCGGIQTMAAYAGAGADINLNGQTFTLGSGGMVLDNGASSTFVLGAAVIGITGGPLDNLHCTGWNANTSTITLNGTCTITGSSTKDIANLVINGTVTLSAASTSCQLTGTLTINNSCSFILADPLYVSGVVTNAGTFTINTNADIEDNVVNTGTIDGTARIYIHGTKTITNSGTWSVANTWIEHTTTLGGGVYGGIWLCECGLTSRTFTFGTAAAQTVTFSGSVTFDADVAGGTYTLACNTWNPDLVFQGSVTFSQTAGTLTYNKGTGTITFSGAADQNIAFMDQSVEGGIVNKSAGNFVLSGGVTFATFAGTSTGTGDFDPNGQAITVSGACDWAAAFLFDSAADCLNACTWAITGAFTCNGQTLNANAAWYLQCHGTAVASGTGTVAYCDASGAGHTEIDASAGPWTDGLNNVNWNFGAAGAIMNQFQFSNLGADLFDGALI